MVTVMVPRRGGKIGGGETFGEFWYPCMPFNAGDLSIPIENCTLWGKRVAGIVSYPVNSVPIGGQGPSEGNALKSHTQLRGLIDSGYSARVDASVSRKARQPFATHSVAYGLAVSMAVRRQHNTWVWGFRRTFMRPAWAIGLACRFRTG